MAVLDFDARAATPVDTVPSDGKVLVMLDNNWAMATKAALKGDTGAAGAPGSVLRDGVGAPSNGLGVDGDYYLNRTNGDLYKKAAGAYTVTANLVGPTGATGAAGSNGPNSVSGSTTTSLTGHLSGNGSVVVSSATVPATDLSGTLADGRLSANVPLKNAVNVFTPTATTDVPLTIQCMVGQSANLANFKNSSGTVVASVGQGGAVACLSVAASTLAGSGTAISNLNASALGSGTVPDARFPGTLPVASGVALTNLNASNLASGTVAADRLPATLTPNRLDIPANDGSEGISVNGSAFTVNFNGVVSTLGGITVSGADVTISGGDLHMSGSRLYCSTVQIVGYGDVINSDGSISCYGLTASNISVSQLQIDGVTAIDNSRNLTVGSISCGSVDAFSGNLHGGSVNSDGEVACANLNVNSGACNILSTGAIESGSYVSVSQLNTGGTFIANSSGVGFLAQGSTPVGAQSINGLTTIDVLESVIQALIAFGFCFDER